MTHDPLCELAADGGTSLLITGPTEFCFGCEKVAKVRSDERERVLEQWAAGKVQGYTSNDWILDAVRQKNYQRGQRDMLAECIAVLDKHHPRCSDPCELCAEWSALREGLGLLEGKS